LIILLGCLILTIGIYFIPPVHDRLAWRLDNLRTQIKYFFNPPESVVFVPTQQSLGTSTPMNTKTPTATSLPDLPTVVPTLTATPLPEAVRLTGITYVNQCNRWNYCGAANLTMALNYWGWKGDRDDVATVVKPGENNLEMDFIQRGKSDFNIMPYEMVDFANDNTDLRALYRYGGDSVMLKRMVAAGFPVIIEKGYYQRDYTGRISWMGHYSFITGYDEVQEMFVWQDSYPNSCQDKEDYSVVERKGRDNLIAYDDLLTAWRSFDYVFIVVYPPEREADVMNALGPWADWNWAAGNALEMAIGDTSTQNGNDLFFSWFNVGTSHVALQQYADAAPAFDQAFTLYAGLSNDDTQRPYRILWYQTGPYWAYYYSGRYQDVINLADTTLTAWVSTPTIEESFYWRGLAEYALGEYDAAYIDMRQAVYYNQNFQAALSVMAQWGITP
jgi:tetratricopeptide (TPR) repeat protein